jgi:hypothetical protein
MAYTTVTGLSMNRPLKLSSGPHILSICRVQAIAFTPSVVSDDNSGTMSLGIGCIIDYLAPNMNVLSIPNSSPYESLFKQLSSIPYLILVKFPRG